MDHDLVVEGFGFRLRPVRMDDAAFIVELRSDSERCRFVNPISPRIPEQEEWLRRYFARAGDYYFIVEDAATGMAEGTIGVYDVSEENNSAEVGRWVLLAHSHAAHASSFLAWQVAMEVLNLRVFYLRTVENNRQVRSFLRFYQAFGLEDNGLASQPVNLRGTLHRMVEYQMTRATWERRRDELRSKVDALTRMCRGS